MVVSTTNIIKNIKGKGETLDIAPLTEETSLQKRSGMARVVEGFHSFTCTPTHLFTNGMNHTCLCLPNRRWSSVTSPGGMEGWVGLSTTTVTIQSAQDRYVTGITVVSCSNRHVSKGNCERSGWASNSRPLGPWATTLTTEPPSHPLLFCNVCPLSAAIYSKIRVLFVDFFFNFAVGL